jgi:hypothetical protein
VGEVAIGQAAVERDGADAVEQHQQLGDDMAGGLMRWNSGGHGGVFSRRGPGRSA